MIVYLILAHQSPDQIEALITRLNDNESKYYIHIDAKCDISDFLYLEKFRGVKLIESRVECNWGGNGIVQATLKLLSAASFDDFSHAILLSSQDYPIKSNKYIKSRLDVNVDYIDSFKAESVWNPLLLNKKTTWFKFDLSSERKDIVVLPSIFSKDILSFPACKSLFKLFYSVFSRKVSIHVGLNIILKTFEKRKPYEYELHGGSQWFALSKKTVVRILNLVNARPELVSYFDYVLVPDEIFFATIVRYLESIYSDTVIKNSITYVDWTRKNVPLPVTFDIGDVDILVNCGDGYLFARKISNQSYHEVVNKLDNFVREI